MKLGFGHKEIELNVESSRVIASLKPNEVPYDLVGEEEVRRSLSNPIGTKPLKELVKKGMKVAIITSDITRPLPSKVVLPPILEELASAGIKKDDIVIVFALGSHRPHTKEEKIYLVGEEIYNEYKCIDNEADKVTHLGVTKYGTDVDIFTPVAEADFIICVGNIEYHYFAGYSGGAKAIMPGVSTPKAIQQNHSMMVHPDAKQGNNLSPVRVDVEEAGSILGIDFIVNVILDEHKKVIHSVAGDYILAHREGCKFLDSLYAVKIKEKADIVVVSAGGFPKDQNLYQAQKALDNAKEAVKDNGIIIWVASAEEGFGSASFERWMTTKTPDQMIEDIQIHFELGGHKAVAIAKVLKKAKTFFVSLMDDELVRSIGFAPYHSIQKAYDDATKLLGNDSSVILMPYGGSTLPVLEDE